MDFKIIKYNKAGLQELINSEDYLNSDVYPISPDRARSHISNPRLDEEGIILITATIDGKLVGYRTAMADWVFNGAEKIKLAWISGTWIHPIFRRKGLATKLFDELNKDWNSNLMYTNYAPNSKKLFDKTQIFKMYSQSIGKRFYVRMNTAEIIPSRWSNTSLFRPWLMMADWLFNLIVLPLIVRRVSFVNESYKQVDFLSDNQIEKLFNNCLSKRGKEEFHWIVNNHWVIDDGHKEDRQAGKYFFSWVAKPYRLYFVVVNEGTENEAVFMISIKGKRMKIPYYYFNDQTSKFMAELLFSEAVKNKVSEIDLFDEKLVEILMNNRQNFIFAKTQERKYMVSKAIFDKFPNSKTVKVPDGEGDVVFV